MGLRAFSADRDVKDHNFANVPYLLHTISSLPQDVLVGTSELVLAGLAMCTDEPGPLRSEIMTSPDFWSLLRVLARGPESAAPVFDILDKGTLGSPPAIMADNYEAAVALLNDFASVAAPPAPAEQSNSPHQANAEHRGKVAKT